ncbi:MAG: hypothetical protein U9Q91_03150 [Candidatus Marinimicrobia bacterium]|nr:hypothetical protein [Candidatus Neomarinimicrobiota bacterium]
MKKVLIITYYWPPAGGPGVQRVLNIVEHLSEFGWEPLILTVETPSAPAVDKSLLSRIPKNCKVYRTRTSEPFTAYKKLTGRKTEDALPKNVSLDILTIVSLAFASSMLWKPTLLNASIISWTFIPFFHLKSLT